MILDIGCQEAVPLRQHEQYQNPETATHKCNANRITSLLDNSISAERYSQSVRDKNNKLFVFSGLSIDKNLSFSNKNLPEIGSVEMSFGKGQPAVFNHRESGTEECTLLI